MAKDFYTTLNIEKTASQSEIKKAFYKLAQKYHPDKPDGDEDKFKEINEAYQVLSDEKKRAQYDQFGSADGNPFGGGGGFGGFQGGQGFDFNGVDLEDILGQFGFGGFGRRKGQDVQMHLELSFKEAILGIEKEIDVPDFENDSTGAKTKKVKVTVPAGVDNGQRIRLTGFGYPIENGEPGDLYLVIVSDTHETLRREGPHLVMDIELKLTEAIQGVKKEIDALEGKIKIPVPAGTKTGDILRVKGKGVPMGHRSGDLLVIPKVLMPKKLSKKAKEAIEILEGEGF